MLLRYIRIPMLVILFLCALLLPSVTSPRLAFAADNPIAVIFRTDTIHFPNSIDFDINAKDTGGNISQATIFIDFNIPGYRERTSSHNVIISHPAGTVTLHWHEDTSSSNFYPAGTYVSYYWQLQDNAGHSLIDLSQHFSTIDSRFNWQSLSQGMLYVHWYNRSLDFGQTMLDKANASLTHISTVLGSGLLHPINLWIYETDNDFHGSLGPNSYEWVGGEALPPLREAFIVAVDTTDTTLVRDMPHELTHLVFHQLIEQGIQVPVWFDEGLAVYNQIYHEADMTARLQAALDMHALLRLDEISYSFPANADQAYLAYAQSWNLVGYMYSTFGQAKMKLFIKLLNNSQANFNQDLQQALGEDQAHLENQWRIHLHQPPTLAPDQVTPTPTAKLQSQPKQPPAQTQTNTDNSVLLLTIGILLVLGSLAALTLIIVNRRRQQALATQSAQQLIAANAMRWQQSNQVPPNMHTSLYVQSADNWRSAAPPSPFSAPPAPANEWDYPDAESHRPEGEGERAGRPAPLPFAHGQEYLSQQPRRQTPQE